MIPRNEIFLISLITYIKSFPLIASLEKMCAENIVQTCRCDMGVSGAGLVRRSFRLKSVLEVDNCFTSMHPMSMIGETKLQRYRRILIDFLHISSTQRVSRLDWLTAYLQSRLSPSMYYSASPILQDSYFSFFSPRGFSKSLPIAGDPKQEYS